MRRTLTLIAVLLAAGAVLAQPLGGVKLPVSRPSTGPATTRLASTRFTTMPKALVERWVELKGKREEAVAFARGLDEGGVPQAHKNYNELRAATKLINEMIAPYAEASPMRYPSPQPKPGTAGEAIWFYKACRAIERYNAEHKGDEDAMSYRVHQLTNEYREALGLMPLEMHDALLESARGHSAWMSESGKMEHTSDVPGKREPSQRMTVAGYHWRGCAENIAMGHPTAQAVFDGWFESPHHHHNVVGAYVHLGVANVNNYWTENFAIGEPTKAGRK